MGRSQETFSKKEREKSRVRKRKDKEEKKAERKANTTKGKSLEDMMAYVDENGNISDVPPDPKKKREIIAEDIQISSPKHIIEEPGIREGKVTFFNEAKGYGFIKDKITQEGVFVHINNLSGPLKENDKVTFEVEEGPKGLQATKVTLVTA